MIKNIQIDTDYCKDMVLIEIVSESKTKSVNIVTDCIIKDGISYYPTPVYKNVTYINNYVKYTELNFNAFISYSETDQEYQYSEYDDYSEDCPKWVKKRFSIEKLKMLLDRKLIFFKDEDIPDIPKRLDTWKSLYPGLNERLKELELEVNSDNEKAIQAAF